MTYGGGDAAGKGMHYVDVGTSGGSGLERGSCLMIGGGVEAVRAGAGVERWAGGEGARARTQAQAQGARVDGGAGISSLRAGGGGAFCEDGA